MLFETLLKGGTLAAALGNLGLGIYVVARGPRQKLNQTFGFFAFIIFIWAFANFMVLVTKAPLFWFRSAYAMGSLGAMAALYLFLVLLQKKIGIIKKAILFGSALLLCLLCYTSLVWQTEGFSLTLFGFEGVAGKLFPLWAFCTGGVLVLAVVVLIRGYLKAEGRLKTQITYVFLAIALPICWTLLTAIILPLFGIKQLANLDTPSTILICGVIAYAIVKHELMGIEVLFFKALVAAFLIVGLAASAVLFVFLGIKFFTSLGVQGVVLMGFLVAVILFVIGRMFFGKTKQLEESKANLEIKVQDRTKDLEKLTASLEDKVKQRTEELQSRVDELEKFHKLTVGRELKMAELKKEVQKLETQEKVKQKLKV